jgi:hypothetical protein
MITHTGDWIRTRWHLRIEVMVLAVAGANPALDLTAYAKPDAHLKADDVAHHEAYWTKALITAYQTNAVTDPHVDKDMILVLRTIVAGKVGLGASASPASAIALPIAKMTAVSAGSRKPTGLGSSYVGKPACCKMVVDNRVHHLWCFRFHSDAPDRRHGPGDRWGWCIVQFHHWIYAVFSVHIKESGREPPPFRTRIVSKMSFFPQLHRTDGRWFHFRGATLVCNIFDPTTHT